MTFSPAPMCHLRIILLLICLFFLPGCQGPTAVVKPDGAGQPPTMTAAPFSQPEPSPSPAPTLTAAPPVATPLPKLEAPLVWYAQGTAPENAPARLEELNKVLLEQGLNVQLDIRYIETGLFERRMAEIRAGGEDWDLVSLSGAQYDLWQSQDALLPLGPSSLSGLAPTALSPSPMSALQALYREGQIFAVSAPVPWAKARGISIRADVVQALDLEDDLHALRSFQDLTPLLEKVQAAVESGELRSAGVENGEALRGAAGSAAILFPEASGYTSLWGPLVTRADVEQGADAGGVVNWYAAEEFQQLAALRLAWQEAGFLPGEPLTPDQLIESYREGRYALEIGQEIFPGSAARQSERYGYAWIDIPLTRAWITTESMLTSVTGLNARLEKDPERARRAALLLKATHADEQVRRQLTGLLGWECWGSPRDVRAWNVAARFAPGLGFVFDLRPVGAEAAALTGAAPEYVEPLANGQRPDIERELKALGNFLESAGMSRIQAELEAQYAAWQSAQN